MLQNLILDSNQIQLHLNKLLFNNGYEGLNPLMEVSLLLICSYAKSNTYTTHTHTVTKVFYQKWEEKKKKFICMSGLECSEHTHTHTLNPFRWQRKQKERKYMGLYCLILGEWHKISMYFISSIILKFALHVKLLNYEHSKSISKRKTKRCKRWGKNWRWFEHKSLWKYFV